MKPADGRRLRASLVGGAHPNASPLLVSVLFLATLQILILKWARVGGDYFGHNQVARDW
jgi:hypothetical protein